MNYIIIFMMLNSSINIQNMQISQIYYYTLSVVRNVVRKSGNASFFFIFLHPLYSNLSFLFRSSPNMYYASAKTCDAHDHKNWSRVKGKYFFPLEKCHLEKSVTSNTMQGIIDTRYFSTHNFQ